MIVAILWDGKKLKEVLMDPNEKPIYKQAQELIECRTITSHTFNRDIEAYVDDEGLLQDDYEIRVLWTNLSQTEIIGHIAGNILFVNHDEQGNTVSLNYNQMKKIYHMQKIDDKLIIQHDH